MCTKYLQLTDQPLFVADISYEYFTYLYEVQQISTTVTASPFLYLICRSFVQILCCHHYFNFIRPATNRSPVFLISSGLNYETV